MGLDMYLTKKTYLGTQYDFNNVNIDLKITKDGVEVPININKIDSITEDVAYWRKANQIHRWFVDNVQDGVDDCNEHYVEITDLCKLVDLCRTVLADHSLAYELLPVQSGFFFGSTDYDEDYYWDLENTIKMLSPLIEEYDKLPESLKYTVSFEYCSSW